ncbi:MAG: hypothetical protein Q8Q25_02835 [bacterium]|nr:hypothetical protein [bacterium]
MKKQMLLATVLVLSASNVLAMGSGGMSKDEIYARLARIVQPENKGVLEALLQDRISFNERVIVTSILEVLQRQESQLTGREQEEAVASSSSSSSSSSVPVQSVLSVVPALDDSEPLSDVPAAKKGFIRSLLGGWGDAGHRVARNAFGSKKIKALEAESKNKQNSEVVGVLVAAAAAAAEPVDEAANESSH